MTQMTNHLAHYIQKVMLALIGSVEAPDTYRTGYTVAHEAIGQGHPQQCVEAGARATGVAR